MTNRNRSLKAEIKLQKPAELLSDVRKELEDVYEAKETKWIICSSHVKSDFKWTLKLFK